MHETLSWILEPRPLPPTSYTPQTLILMKWPPHQECTVVMFLFLNVSFLCKNFDYHIGVENEMWMLFQYKFWHRRGLWEIVTQGGLFFSSSVHIWHWPKWYYCWLQKKNLTNEQIKAYVPDVMGQFSDIIKVLQILNNHFKFFFFFFIQLWEWLTSYMQ